MPDPDGATAAKPPIPAPADTESEAGAKRAALHGIAHSINGALNSLALNVELLDRSTAKRVGSEEDELARARYLASLRRAIREIQEIVEQRLGPLGRQDGTDVSR